jgi:lipopolysaccharide/colanic/teichoic acid biosynthesis glycosyltransferase
VDITIRAPISHWWKRPLDLAIGLPLTVLALPIIAVLAVAVCLDSRGPAFFVQERVGRDGERFRLWKLRSMYHQTSDGTHREAAAVWFEASAADNCYKSLADSRITRVGRFLRRTNLDELPQLFNVVRGDMSLVGPRPAIPYELDYYLPHYFERQRVRPGITGLWQISDRMHLSAAEMMALDAEYVRLASPWLDLRIVARTALMALSALLRGR